MWKICHIREISIQRRLNFEGHILEERVTMLMRRDTREWKQNHVKLWLFPVFKATQEKQIFPHLNFSYSSRVEKLYFEVKAQIPSLLYRKLLKSLLRSHLLLLRCGVVVTFLASVTQKFKQERKH